MAWAIIYTRVTSDTVGDEVKEDDKEHGNLGEVTCYHFHVTIASAKAQWKSLAQTQLLALFVSISKSVPPYCTDKLSIAKQLHEFGTIKITI